MMRKAHARVAIGLAVLVACAVGAYFALRAPTTRDGVALEQDTLARDSSATPLREAQPSLDVDSIEPRASEDAITSRPLGVGPASDAPGALQRLLEELEAADREADFDRRAAEILSAFVSVIDPPTRSRLPVELRETLAARSFSSRVRGALLALLAACGSEAEVLTFLPASSEETRSALIGMGWDPDGGAEGIHIEPWAFLDLVSHWPEGLTILRLPLSRPPTEILATFLEGELLRPALSREELVERELAVLALGTGVDKRPATLELFRRILLDPDPRTLPLHESILYVLSKAESAAARGILQAFLNQPAQAAFDGDEWSRSLARYWLSAAKTTEGDLEVLLAPLLDAKALDPGPQPSSHRIIAAGALLQRLSSQELSDAQKAQVEAVLSRRVSEEPNDAARTATTTALVEITDGGWMRLEALSTALTTDRSATVRKVAASGLAKTKGPYAAAALASLQSALDTERDPGVREAIARWLKQLAERADED